MQPHLYIFSGLGVDERAFSGLDWQGLPHTYMPWIAPLRGESIGDYARRIAAPIQTPSPVLVGLSFGGMIALEIAKFLPVDRVILLASVKTRAEMPPSFKFAAALRLNKIVPVEFLRNPGFFHYWFFGVASAADKALLKAILADTDPVFLRWAIEEILHWGNVGNDCMVTHIHGDRDRAFPIRYVEVDFVVRGAGHFMTVTDAGLVNEVLREVLGEML